MKSFTIYDRQLPYFFLIREPKVNVAPFNELHYPHVLWMFKTDKQDSHRSKITLLKF